MRKPESNEYASFYKGYIDSVEGIDIINELMIVSEKSITVFNSIIDGNFTYEKGKWSAKELIRHIIDTEWVMSYRALCIARGDKTSLPGFDQDQYQTNCDMTDTKLSSLIDEYKSLRLATVSLFNSFNEAQYNTTGKASGWNISVLALAFIIAGHNKHHLKILSERYF